METAAPRRSPRLSSRTSGSSSKRKLTEKSRRSTSRSPGKTSAEKKRDKRKRRSSIRRQSFVAALEGIRSSSTPPLNKEKRDTPLAEVQEQQELVENSDKESKITTETRAPNGSVSKETDSTNHSSAALPAKCTEPPSQLAGENYLTRLRTELEGWREQKQKYKAEEMSAKEEATSRVYFPSSELKADALLSKYNVYSEQIDDLTDKLTSAVQTVSNTMSVVHKIQELHKINLRKLTEAEVAKVSEARGGDDPRWLIEGLFELENAASKP